MFTDDYIKFLSNIKTYCNQPLRFISYKESKWSDILEKRGGLNITCPIAKLDDIEVVFLHYKTEHEAREKWTRRCKRINWNNLIVKMTQQNLCSEEHLRQFEALPYKKKFVFVTKDYGLSSQVLFKKYLNQKEVAIDTVYFRHYVNLIKLVKGKPFKKRQ